MMNFLRLQAIFNSKTNDGTVAPCLLYSCPRPWSNDCPFLRTSEDVVGEKFCACSYNLFFICFLSLRSTRSLFFTCLPNSYPEESWPAKLCNPRNHKVALTDVTLLTYLEVAITHCMLYIRYGSAVLWLKPLEVK